MNALKHPPALDFESNTLTLYQDMENALIPKFNNEMKMEITVRNLE